MDNDPLAEPEVCRCGGVGMVQIGEHAVQQAMAKIVAEGNAKRAERGVIEVEGVEIPDEGFEAWLAQREAAIRDTWYPCRNCRGKIFFRWAKGCWEPGHDREACEICSKLAESVPRRRRAR